MNEEYRICKVAFDLGGFAYPNDDMMMRPVGTNIVERYEVQVKGTFMWHTVKTFKKIRPAVRLYHYLKGLKE